MVINRAIRSWTGGKTFQLPKFHGDPINYLISDSAGRRRRRRSRKAGVPKGTGAVATGIKLYNQNTSLTGIGPVSQTVSALLGVDAGNEESNRVSNHIRLRSLRVRGMIQWGATGTPANQARIVVYFMDTGATPPNINVGDFPYGRKTGYTMVRHVLFDKIITRKNSDQLYTPFNYLIRLRGAHIQYNGPTGSTDLVTKDLRVSWCSDTSSSSTNVVNTSYGLRFTG